jgi:hypothetical protein
MGLYTLSWLLIEAKEGLGEDELIDHGTDYWTEVYDEPGVIQVFWLPNSERHAEMGPNFLDGCPRREPIALKEFFGENWPPGPVSYRTDPARFAGLLALLKEFVANIEDSGERRFHFLPPFRDTRGPENGWPELAVIPSSTIPEELPEPGTGVDFYLVPLWNEC